MSVWRFMLEVSKPYRLYIWGIVLAMCFIAADKNIKPYLIKTIIDAVNVRDYSNMGVIIAIYAIVQFIMVASWTLFDLCNNRLYPQMKGHITRILLQKIGLYPYTFFQNHLSGSISSKISDAAKLTPQLITTMILELFQISVVLLISIILLARVHYGFSLAIIIWVALFCGIGYRAVRKASFLTTHRAESDSRIWGDVVDHITNMFAVKIFTSLHHEHQRIDHLQEDYRVKSMVVGNYLMRFYITQGLLFSCYILLCLYSTIRLHQSGQITSGDFALIFMLNFELVSWLFQLADIMKEFITNWGTVGQALSLLEVPGETEDQPNAKALVIKHGEITFDKVKFHYKGTEPLFQNKTVTIEARQKVGLVGYSGGGKSTFVSLILRLYDVTDGRILIDGQDIRTVTQDSLRANIGMIPQDPSLFHRTLMENIRYGRIEANDDEVIVAARKAHAHEFIIKLPHGYESLVGERGVKLSGGQRQRIAIARAILKNAPILILDEATSQLDSITESAIQESLWNLIQGKTTIVIAHRLSTLLHMDRILVFDKGKIVEDGTHRELLARGGLYKTLWDAQVGGFLPDKINEEA